MSDTEAPFRWPPPGLERMQGDLWRVVTRGALASVFLVLPLLFVAARATDFASLGPLGDAWWVTLILWSVGLAFATDAFSRVARILSRGARAVERGYRRGTILQVVADTRRDTGFLLQGARHFSSMDEADRRTLLNLRVLTPVLHAAGGLWACLAVGLGVLAAARGWIAPMGLWTATLGPAVLFHVFGAITGLTEELRVRRARRAWHGQAWIDDLDPERIRGWRQIAEGGWTRVPSGEGDEDLLLRRSSRAAWVVAVLIAVPVLVLMPVSAIGPVLSRAATPPSESIQRRAAELEAYRAYRVDPDPGVTPGEAGRLLQALAYVGSTDSVPRGQLGPMVRVPRPWLPDEGRGHPSGVPPSAWHESLFSEDRERGEDLRAFLAEIAEHPSRPDFSRLSRASRIDVAAGRWADPFPPEVVLQTVPPPNLAAVRAAARTHLAAAALASMEGSEEVAELRIREVLSVGFLLADEGPTLIDNLMGHALVREAGSALLEFFRASARDDRADELDRAVAMTERAANRLHSGRPSSTEALVRTLPSLVLDTATVRGLAWENFALLATLAPCLNLNRAVFGPGEGYRAFVGNARDVLVRWPSEQALFEVAAQGFFGVGQAPGVSWMGRLMGVAVRSGEGSCGRALSALRGLN